MKFLYNTKLIFFNKKIIPFYKYNNNIGYIPAEINFTYKTKIYTTIQLMDLLSALYYKKKFNIDIAHSFKINEWYDDTGDKFNKILFIKYIIQLNKLNKK